MHRRSTVYKQKQSQSSLNKYIDVRGQQRMEEWESKCLNNGFVSYKHTPFLLHKTLIIGLEWCGLL